MHTLSHATALPHHRGLQCQRSHLSTTPTRLQEHMWSSGTLLWIQAEFSLSVREKGRRAIYSRVSAWHKHQKEIWTPYLPFCWELQHSLHVSASQNAHHPPQLPHFLWLMSLMQYIETGTILPPLFLQPFQAICRDNITFCWSLD